MSYQNIEIAVTDDDDYNDDVMTIMIMMTMITLTLVI